MTYNGTSDPGVKAIDVFSGCTNLIVNVPDDYKDDYFCGIKLKNHNTNAAIIASTVSVAVAVVVAVVAAMTYYFKKASSPTIYDHIRTPSGDGFYDNENV